MFWFENKSIAFTKKTKSIAKISCTFCFKLEGEIVKKKGGSLRELMRHPKALVTVVGLTLGFPYSITVALFGGTAEYIALWFKNVGHETYFYGYVTVCIFISLLVYSMMKDTRKTSTFGDTNS